MTLILATAIVRARSLLVRAVTEQLASDELLRFFAPDIAERIRFSDPEIKAGTGEVRKASVVNLDMRGFTQFTESHPPERVMELLADYQDHVIPLIRKHGGSVDKFLGDGILATFGATRSSVTYAADSLRALDEVLMVTAKWRDERRSAGRSALEVNGSVATGRILCGAVGNKARLEYTVIGDAVNLSAKLEKQNKIEGTRALADQDTYEHALAQGYLPPGERVRLASCTVAGVRDPMDLVVVA